MTHSLKISRNIFKYGEPYTKISNNKKRTFTNISETVQLQTNFVDVIESVIDNKIEEIVPDILDDILPEVLDDDLPDILENLPEDPDTTINPSIFETINITNIFNNIETSEFISPWAFDTEENTYTFSNVSINTSDANNYNLNINGNMFSTELNTKKIIFKNNNDNILITKNDAKLYYNNEKISNIVSDDISIDISPWQIDSNENAYTFSKIGINTTVNNDYDLTVKNKVLVGDSLFFDSSQYKVHVSNGHLYFNNCRLDKCDIGTISETLSFYLCFEYSGLDLVTFEENIKTQINELDSTIDFTYLKFDINDIVQVTISIRDDICINDNQKIIISASLKKIYTIISEGSLSITENSITRLAITNIYLLNEYYHYEEVDPSNAFKLVKKDDEENSKALLNNEQVYLKNLNNEYLKTDYTFSKTSTNKLLLEVYGYENTFIVKNTTCIINRKESFRLEVLPPTIIDGDLPSFIVGESYMDNIDTFSSDDTWTNPGIDPNLLTDEIFLSDNINSYITDPSKYNKVYLVDERWLTYTEDSSKVATYSYTFEDEITNTNTTKFIDGLKYCEITVPDYVFSNNYKLETIEEHADFMFKNKHLPSLASMYNYKNYISIFGEEQRREDILEELEKAHLYIYRLNNKIKHLENYFKIYLKKH